MQGTLQKCVSVRVCAHTLCGYGARLLLPWEIPTTQVIKMTYEDWADVQNVSVSVSFSLTLKVSFSFLIHK